jgi:radical SAM superfamily enzyme YgiQ (UPF0313 family)
MAEILFVNSTTEHSLVMETNGTLLLGTILLNEGFDVDVLRLGDVEEYQKDYSAFIRRFTDRVLELNPKCVSFYTLWTHFHIMLRVARELKSVRPELIIVMAGPQVSSTAAEVMEAMNFVDYVCYGEGENTVVPFFRALLRNGGEGIDQVPQLYYRKDDIPVCTGITAPPCDLETLPHWDDRLYLDQCSEEPVEQRTSASYYMNIDVGRGCPFNCTFCSSSLFWKRRYRLKSPQKIVEEILHWNTRFGIRSFRFSHDAFTVNNKLVYQVCDELDHAGLNITWTCTSRVDCINEALIERMVRSGMVRIELGVESGSPRMQKIINKKLDLNRLSEMVDVLLKHNVEVNLFFMCGFPEETVEDLAMTMDLLFATLDRGVHHASMAFCHFYPGTAITRQYFDQLVLDHSIKVLPRSLYGCAEEVEMIENNKAIFPFFYHLETPVRREFQYLRYLIQTYEYFPNSIAYLRKLYQGDHITFYRDFIRLNQNYLDGPAPSIPNLISRHSAETFGTMVDQFAPSYGKQLKSLLQYDYDMHRIKTAKADVTIQNLYHFDAKDLEAKLPIQEYRNRSCIIRLEKKNGKINQAVIPLS